MLRNFWTDEGGFIVSAELVLVATIVVIGMIVGLSEVHHAVVTELNDVSSDIGYLNQSYQYSGFTKTDSNSTIHAKSIGSSFGDRFDDCDKDFSCAHTCNPAEPEL